MERLTKRIVGGVCHYDCTDTCSSCCGCECLDVWKMLDKLAAYEDAEEQGRLVVLPCKEGSKVYMPRTNNVLECTVQYFTIGDGEPSAFVSFECDWECMGCPFWSPYTNYEAGDGGCEGEYGDGLIMLDAFGKDVFLTREAAEAALKEMEGK